MMECPIDYCFDDCLAIEKVNMTQYLSYTNHISSILTYILNSWYKNNWEIPQKQKKYRSWLLFLANQRMLEDFMVT